MWTNLDFCSHSYIIVCINVSRNCIAIAHTNGDNHFFWKGRFY